MPSPLRKRVNRTARERSAAQSVHGLSDENIDRFYSAISRLIENRGRKAAGIEQFRELRERVYAERKTY